MSPVYLLIGGNMGDRMEYLQLATNAIHQQAGRIISRSAIYETEAWGLTNQDKFLNQALCIETLLSPKELLQTLLQIEQDLGRKRETRYGPRIIDIDILFYGQEIISEPAIAGEARHRGAELLRAFEIGQRCLRIAIGNGDCAHARLRQRAARILLVGPREEARGSLRVAELERGLAGANQGIEILGFRCERAHVAGQRRRRAFVIGRIAALRGSGHNPDRPGAKRQGHSQAKSQQSPHRPSPVRHRILPEAFCLEGLR